MSHICAEVEYGPGIHSDICAENVDQLADPDYRKFLHDCLDEWLDNSHGTGVFYIGRHLPFAPPHATP